MNRIHHERTEEIAREVLLDLKCLENAKYKCAWLGEPPNAKVHRPELRIPCIIIEFTYPQEDRAPALCIRFTTNGFANGSPLHDEKIRYVIRDKVEKYLKQIGHDPGINTPQDMNLDGDPVE